MQDKLASTNVVVRLQVLQGLIPLLLFCVAFDSNGTTRLQQLLQLCVEFGWKYVLSAGNSREVSTMTSTSTLVDGHRAGRSDRQRNTLLSSAIRESFRHISVTDLCDIFQNKDSEYSQLVMIVSVLGSDDGHTQGLLSLVDECFAQASRGLYSSPYRSREVQRRTLWLAAGFGTVLKIRNEDESVVCQLPGLQRIEEKMRICSIELMSFLQQILRDGIVSAAIESSPGQVEPIIYLFPLLSRNGMMCVSLYNDYRRSATDFTKHEGCIHMLPSDGRSATAVAGTAVLCAWCTSTTAWSNSERG